MGIFQEIVYHIFVFINSVYDFCTNIRPYSCCIWSCALSDVRIFWSDKNLFDRLLPLIIINAITHKKKMEIWHSQILSLSGNRETFENLMNYGAWMWFLRLAPRLIRSRGFSPAIPAFLSFTRLMLDCGSLTEYGWKTLSSESSASLVTRFYFLNVCI